MSTPHGRALLIHLAEGKPCADFAGVATALGMSSLALDRLAQRAYPLSAGDSAAQHLVRDLGRILIASTQAVGLEAALAELAAAASDPRSEVLLALLTQC